MGKAGAAERKGLEDVLEGADKVALARRVEVHDDTHLEVKLDYGLPARGRKIAYDVEIYFFFPGSLDVNPDSYPQRDFYRDIQAYLRFRTPDLYIDDLASTTAPESPLARLIEFEQGAARGSNHHQDEILEEAKLFGCLARSYLRDTSRRLLHLAGTRISQGRFGGSKPFETSLRRFHERARGLLDGYRKVLRCYDSSPGDFTPAVQAALRDVEQFLSYEYERRFARLVQRLRRKEAAIAEIVEGPILRGLREEIHYREVHGLPPGPARDADNEAYLRRSGFLKKFVASVLYLNLERTATQEEWSDWVGALAAGIAMGMAFLATKAFDQGQAMNLYVVLTVVLIYVMKDRLKDMIKRRLSADNMRWLADMDWKLRDTRTSKVIGRCQETTRWIPLGEVPSQVHDLRGVHSETHRDLRRATGETVLWYRKIVTLYPKVLHAIHTRRGDVNDIIRIGVAHFMAHLDSTLSKLPALTGEDGEIETVRARKTYALVLVLRYAARGQPPIYEKLRVRLDAKGIRQVHTVVPPTREDQLGVLASEGVEEMWERAEG